MRVAIVVNDIETLVATQTTAMLGHTASRRGVDVGLVPAINISMTPTGLFFSAHRAAPNPDLGDWVRGIETEPDWECADEFDQIWVRTNPGRSHRPEDHRAMLDLLCLTTVPVINAPLGLQKAFTKLYLEKLPPHVRARSFVSSDPRAILSYVSSQTDPVVVKPISGTRGRGVFILKPGDPNLRSTLELLDGPIIVQEVLPEYIEGDVRVVILDGVPLEIDEKIAAIHRVPSTGDFRSNIHTGAVAKPTAISSTMYDAAITIGEILVEDGIRLAGLDFIGPKVCEVNVFSTGGLRDAQRFYDRAFADHIVDRFLGED